jgi:hypothetical protein
MTAVNALHEAGVTPSDEHLLFSNYEEAALRQAS